jgi:H+-transporting ATPase
VEVDQLALTAESLLAGRKLGEAVFSGSIIPPGEIDARVYGTGSKPYFGETAKLVQETHTTSHFQRALRKIGKYLIMLAVTRVAVMTAAPLLKKHAAGVSK